MKNFIEILKESRFQSKVHRNPSVEAIKNLARNSEYGEARFVIAKSHQLHVGDGQYHTHDMLTNDINSHYIEGYVLHRQNSFKYTANLRLQHGPDHTLDHPILERFRKHGIKYKHKIEERVRTPEEASKLVDYMDKRNIKHKVHADIHGKVFSWQKHERKRIPIKDLHTTQGWLKGPRVKRQLNTDRKPITVVNHQGTHYIKDGHHRVMAARLRGETHIDAKVYHTKKSWGEKLFGEAVRTPERAKKLADYLHKRTKDKSAGMIGTKSSSFPRTSQFTLSSQSERKRVPLRDIKTTQNYVYRKGLDHHIDHPGKAGPVTLINHGGSLHSYDGHHRIMAARLRGDTHIDSEVIPARSRISKSTTKMSLWQKIKKHFTESIISKADAIKKIHDIKKKHKLNQTWYGKGQIPSRTTIPKVPQNKTINPDLASPLYKDKSEHPHHRYHDDITNKKYRVANVPIHTVVTGQTNVSADVLEKKVQRNWGKHTPRLPLFLRLKNGHHYIVDGNHRVAARAIRGYTHIRGHVIDLDE